MTITYDPKSDDQVDDARVYVPPPPPDPPYGVSRIEAALDDQRFEEYLARLAPDEPIVLQMDSPETLPAEKLMDLARQHRRRVVVRPPR